MIRYGVEMDLRMFVSSTDVEDMLKWRRCSIAQHIPNRVILLKNCSGAGVKFCSDGLFAQEFSGNFVFIAGKYGGRQNHGERSTEVARLSLSYIQQ